MKQWVGLLDCNNFFVSCERLFRPDLIGKPALVLSSNDGCVVARSQEVKDIGIPMGVPYFKIKDILKTNNVEVFSGNPTLYRDISKRVFTAMREVLEDIEQYSIDEAFFIIQSEDPTEIAFSIKDNVERQVGIPVSIGLASSKTLAKIAGREAKRASGLFVLNDEDWAEKQQVTDLSQVWGIGTGMSKRFRAHDLNRVADLLKLDDRQVKQLFGVVGLRLKMELSGNVLPSKKVAGDSQKSLMSSRTLSDPTMDIEVLRGAVAYHVNHIAEQLRKQHLRAGYLKVYISPSRYGDFVLQNVAKEVYFDNPTNVTSTILVEANKLLETMFVADVPYKKVGVLSADLKPDTASQLSFFEDSTDKKSEELQSSIDQLNKLAGTGKIQIGTVTTGDTWKPRSALRSPSYTTKWTDIATVRAS